MEVTKNLITEKIDIKRRRREFRSVKTKVKSMTMWTLKKLLIVILLHLNYLNLLLHIERKGKDILYYDNS